MVIDVIRSDARIWPHHRRAVGIGSVLNGLWMLTTQVRWYVYIPVALQDFGAPNAHLVRDADCGFLTVGVGLLWALAAQYILCR